jgi:hypothetical protein
MGVHGEADNTFEWAAGTDYAPASAFKCFDVINSIEINQPYENSQSKGLNQLESSASTKGPRMNIIRLGVEFHSLDFLRLALYKIGTTTKRVSGEGPITIQGEIKKGGKFFDFANAVVTNVTMDFSMTGPVTGAVEIHALTMPNAAATGMLGGSHAAAVTTTPYSFGSIIYFEKNSVEKAMRSAAFSLTNQASESHAFNSTGASDPTGLGVGGWEHSLSVVLEDDGAVDFDLAEDATADTVVLHCDAADDLTFSTCAFTNPVLGDDNGINILALDCPNAGVAITAAAFDT